MGANALRVQDDFETLPEIYVIFITEHDVLLGGKPFCHINRHIEEMEMPFGDGEHITFPAGALSFCYLMGRPISRSSALTLL